MTAPIPTPRRTPEDTGPNCVVVVCPAEIDLVNAPALEETLQRLASHSTWLLLDLSHTTFCDSAGLRPILRAHRHLRQFGGRVGLVAPNPTLRKLLTAVDTSGELRCYSSREAAFTILPESTSRSLSTVTLNPHPITGEDDRR